MRANPYPSLRAPARVDTVRILGYSSAIAINTIAAALLLMPLQIPPAVPAPEAPRTVWIIPAEPDPPVLPPPRDQPRPVNPPTQVASVTVAPARPDVAPVVVEQGVLPAPLPADPAPLASIEAPPAVSGPAPMTLEYAFAPAPPYPRDNLRNGDEGLVLLEVLVGVDGRPLSVEVVDGSGHRALDQAARRHVLAHWRFQPALRDGRAVQAIGRVPIEFALD